MAMENLISSNFENDINLRQVGSGLRNGSAKRNVRRSIFGPTTAEEKRRGDEWFCEKMDQMEAFNKGKSKFYGFDFPRSVPISSKESNFQWFRCQASDVPEFYRGDGNRYDFGVDSIQCQLKTIAQVSALDNDANLSDISVIEDVNNPCSSLCPDLLKNLPISTVDGLPELTPQKPSEVSQTVFGAPPMRRKEQTKLTNFYPQRKRSRSVRSLKGKLPSDEDCASTDGHSKPEDLQQQSKIPRLDHPSSTTSSSSLH